MTPYHEHVRALDCSLAANEIPNEHDIRYLTALRGDPASDATVTDFMHLRATLRGIHARTVFVEIRPTPATLGLEREMWRDVRVYRRAANGARGEVIREWMTTRDRASALQRAGEAAPNAAH